MHQQTVARRLEVGMTVKEPRKQESYRTEFVDLLISVFLTFILLSSPPITQFSPLSQVLSVLSRGLHACKWGCIAHRGTQAGRYSFPGFWVGA